MDKLPTFSKMYVFGDSLSDTGNLFNATTSVLQPFEVISSLEIPAIPPSPPYFEGRSSNGAVWVENLAADLGLTITPSTELSVFRPEIPFSSSITLTLFEVEVSPFFNGATTTQSVNFAFGGAQTGENDFLPVIDIIPGVLTQVEWFVDDHRQVEQLADPDALYVIWTGANDYLVSPNADPEQVVDDLETSIKSLFDLGANNFLIPNIPDLGKIPFANRSNISVSASQLTAFTEQHNSLLEETLDELNGTLNGINLIPLDSDDHFNDVLTNPEEFGLANTTEPCLDSMTSISCSNSEDYLFWDLLHPTASAHEILGDFALETLTLHTELAF